MWGGIAAGQSKWTCGLIRVGPTTAFHPHLAPKHLQHAAPHVVLQCFCRIARFRLRKKALLKLLGGVFDLGLLQLSRFSHHRTPPPIYIL